jgi:hypothetical protein
VVVGSEKLEPWQASIKIFAAAPRRRVPQRHLTKNFGSMVIEMLSAFDLDFVVIDAETCPLGRYEINNLLIAATAAGIAGDRSHTGTRAGTGFRQHLIAGGQASWSRMSQRQPIAKQLAA